MDQSGCQPGPRDLPGATRKLSEPGHTVVFPRELPSTRGRVGRKRKETPHKMRMKIQDKKGRREARLQRDLPKLAQHL